MPALKGAGEAAFQMGDYRTARHYLLPVVAQTRKDEHSMELLNLSELVIKLNPFERGLSSQERARRTVHDFQLALSRAQKCTTPTADLSSLTQQVDSKKAMIRENVLTRNPDTLEATMELAFKLETAASQCGPADLEERALELLAEQEASR
jgi:hypothetical protein